MTVINISDSENSSDPETWFYFSVAGLLFIILICARLIFSQLEQQVP